MTYDSGPFPTLYKVSLLLRELHLATWRRLQEGEATLKKRQNNVHYSRRSQL
jgi:hypothetical protein